MKIFIVGISGKMGKVVCNYAEKEGIIVAGGLDVVASDKYPTFSSPQSVNVDFDAIIDFSRPSSLDNIITLCTNTKKPVVLASTGYTDDQLKKIDDLSKQVAVFRSANMSVGVSAVGNALKLLTSALGGYDIEIIEAHHNQKVDAPSGTALLLLDSIDQARGEKSKVVNGREGESKRTEGEIGMHAIRGGTIVGEHTVMFAGKDEVIEIKHTALSRNIFATGALAAAKFLVGKKSGMYNMNDYVQSQNT